MKAKPGWLVKTQIQRRGRWIDPLPGMDAMNAWFWPRREARAFQRLMRDARPYGRFVVRREAR